MYAGADRWYLVQEVHKDLWKGSNRKFSKIPWHKIEVQRHNAERTPEQQVSPTSMSIRSATMHGHFWENIKTCSGSGTSTTRSSRVYLHPWNTRPARMLQMCSQERLAPWAPALHSAQSLRMDRRAATTLGESTEEGQAAPEEDPGRWH